MADRSAIPFSTTMSRVFDFRREKAHSFLHNGVHIFRLKLRLGRPDGPEKLTDDGIEPGDFRAANVDRFLKFFA